MKNNSSLSFVKRIKITALLLSTCLVLACTLALTGTAAAQDYVSIDIWPPHVGVFLGVPQQQFTAYGVTASGQKVKITDQVDWYLMKYPFSQQTMEPDEIATIDKTGYLTINPGVTWGRVSVTACYPKGCGPNSSGAITPPLSVLLVSRYTVTATNVGTNGSIAPEGDSIVKRARTQTYTLTPDAGYEPLVSGTCPTGSFNVDHTDYTTGPVVSDCTVEFDFVPNTVVTPSVDITDSNGAITPSVATPVLTGQTLTLTLTPDAGYEASFVDDTCGIGGSFNADHTNYTTAAITADCTVNVHFTLSPVVAPSVDTTDSNGAISPSVATPVLTGQTLTFTLTPDAGFEASSIGGDCPSGTFTTGDATYTTGAITANCTVIAHFIASPVVTPTVDVTESNGTINPVVATSVLTGQTLAIALIPDPGFEASSISGTCPTTPFTTGDATYTTGAITANCTVIAHFTAKPQYTLAVNTTGGSIAVPLAGGEVTSDIGSIDCFAPSVGGEVCSDVYNPDDVVTLTVNVIAGEFLGWTGTGCCDNTLDPTCAVTMSTDITCTAAFGPLP